MPHKKARHFLFVRVYSEKYYIPEMVRDIVTILIVLKADESG